MLVDLDRVMPAADDQRRHCVEILQGKSIHQRRGICRADSRAVNPGVIGRPARATSVPSAAFRLTIRWSRPERQKVPSRYETFAVNS